MTTTTEPQTPPPSDSTPTSRFTLPIEVQTKLKLVDQMYDNAMMRLGRLEVEHAAAKERLLIELQEIRKEHGRLIETTAKSAGLDIDKARWLFDNTAMTLTRVTKPE